MKRLALVLIITAIGIFASFVDAFYALILYTWYSFASPIELTYGALSGSRLSLLVGAVLVVTTLAQKKALIKQNLISFLALLFAFFCFISLVYSSELNFLKSLQKTELILKLVLISCLAPLLLGTINKLRLYILCIAISAGLLGCYYGAFGLFAGSRSIEGPGRIGDNNGYAVFLITVLPFIFYSGRHLPYIKNTLLKSALTLGLFMGNVLAIILTFSRGGFLALSFSLTCMIFSVKNNFFKIVSWGVIIPSAAFILWQIFAIDPNSWEVPLGNEQKPTAVSTFKSYVSRLQTLTHQRDEIQSASSRTHFWKVAIEMFKDNPLLGVGFGNYPYQYSKYDFEKGLFGDFRSVHNTFLMILSETGLLGFSSYVLMILACLIHQQKVLNICRKFKKYDEANELADYMRMLRISLLGYTISSFFVNTLIQESFWAIISVSIAGSALAEKLRDEFAERNIAEKETEHRKISKGLFGQKKQSALIKKTS